LHPARAETNPSAGDPDQIVAGDVLSSVSTDPKRSRAHNPLCAFGYGYFLSLRDPRNLSRHTLA
jgi:hypothetical protein